jgi:deoxyribodipyrimidine photo-lyase
MSLMSVVTGLPRPQLLSELAAAFPTAAAQAGEPAAAACQPWRGGRDEAVRRLAAIDPAAYARSRNDVRGSVSRLSPWIRHGLLSLAEVRDAALERAGPDAAEKFISELGWREYWRWVQATVGDAILADLEPPTKVPRATPQDGMPADVLAAATGLACIDDFVRRLHTTGWLHNHERMWLASWLVHGRGVPWRVGADWFLSHLLDGDPASNHLSWQWIAGTFAAKPYIFNRENLERFTGGEHCRRCSLLGHCDVEGDYESLSARLFVPGADPRAAAEANPPLKLRPAEPWVRPTRSRMPLVWITLDSLSPTGPALAAWPNSPTLFVVDEAWLAAERPALKRLVFIWECLADLPGVEVRVGDPAALLPARAADLGCDGVVVADTPCPRVRRAAAAIGGTTPVGVEAWPRFCDASAVRDLTRFSRYWHQVKSSALRPTP